MSEPNLIFLVKNFYGPILHLTTKIKAYSTNELSSTLLECVASTQVGIIVLLKKRCKYISCSKTAEFLLLPWLNILALPADHQIKSHQLIYYCLIALLEIWPFVCSSIPRRFLDAVLASITRALLLCDPKRTSNAFSCLPEHTCLVLLRLLDSLLKDKTVMELLVCPISSQKSSYMASPSPTPAAAIVSLLLPLLKIRNVELQCQCLQCLRQTLFLPQYLKNPSTSCLCLPAVASVLLGVVNTPQTNSKVSASAVSLFGSLLSQTLPVLLSPIKHESAMERLQLLLHPALTVTKPETMDHGNHHRVNIEAAVVKLIDTVCSGNTHDLVKKAATIALEEILKFSIDPPLLCHETICRMLLFCAQERLLDSFLKNQEVSFSLLLPQDITSSVYNFALNDFASKLGCSDQNIVIRAFVRVTVSITEPWSFSKDKNEDFSVGADPLHRKTTNLSHEEFFDLEPLAQCLSLLLEIDHTSTQKFQKAIKTNPLNSWRFVRFTSDESYLLVTNCLNLIATAFSQMAIFRLFNFCRLTENGSISALCLANTFLNTREHAQNEFLIREYCSGLESCSGAIGSITQRALYIQGLGCAFSGLDAVYRMRILRDTFPTIFACTAILNQEQEAVRTMADKSIQLFAASSSQDDARGDVVFNFMHRHIDYVVDAIHRQSPSAPLFPDLKHLLTATSQYLVRASLEPKKQAHVWLKETINVIIASLRINRHDSRACVCLGKSLVTMAESIIPPASQSLPLNKEIQEDDTLSNISCSRSVKQDWENQLIRERKDSMTENSSDEDPTNEEQFTAFKEKKIKDIVKPRYVLILLNILRQCRNLLGYPVPQLRLCVFKMLAAIIPRLKGHSDVANPELYKLFCAVDLEEAIQFKKIGKFTCSAKKKANKPFYEHILSRPILIAAISMLQVSAELSPEYAASQIIERYTISLASSDLPQGWELIYKIVVQEGTLGTQRCREVALACCQNLDRKDNGVGEYVAGTLNHLLQPSLPKNMILAVTETLDSFRDALCFFRNRKNEFSSNISLTDSHRAFLRKNLSRVSSLFDAIDVITLHHKLPTSSK